MVQQFDEGHIKFLVCTSTLIEGVNTKARNMVILDNRIAREQIDLFTFNNIRGRAGRMFEHYIGHVYIFHDAPQMRLPFVDVPAYDQDETNTPESLLLQIDDDDLTDSSRSRLSPYESQDELDLETLRQNVGIAPDVQLEVARYIANNAPTLHPLLFWTGFPRWGELQAVCQIMWEFFNGSRIGSGSAVSANQLAFFINQLRDEPTVSELIQSRLERSNDADEAVTRVLDFLRLWANFHFPRLLRVIDRIQKDVFARMGLSAGSYEFFAGGVESLFLDPSIGALDEYGVPFEVGRKLVSVLSADGDLDETLEKLRELDVAEYDLTDFEQELVKDAQAYV